MDPWHVLGLAHEVDMPGCDAVLLNDTAHCADEYAASLSDPIDLTQLRASQLQYAAGWLKISFDDSSLFDSAQL